MDDADDLDAWETAILPAINVADGVIPAWLEAALSHEAAACPLTSTGAFNAIMRFFIGTPAAKGVFFKELYQEPDPFNSMTSALGSIMKILAKRLVDPLSNAKFPYPVVAYEGGDDDNLKTAFVEAAEARFIDRNNDKTGPHSWFAMLVRKGAAELGARCADAEVPVPGLESYKTTDAATSTVGSSGTSGKKLNAFQQEQITAGVLIDPARLERLIKASPELVACLAKCATRLRKGETLLGNKASVPDPQHLVCDWASDLFYSTENDKFDEEMDMILNSYILPMHVGPTTDYNIVCQPMAKALNARDVAFISFMKDSLSATEGPSGRRMRKDWRNAIMQPAISNDKGGMSKFSLSMRDLRGHEPSSLRPLMLSGTSVADLLIPVSTYLRGVAFHSVRIADSLVRRGLETALNKFYECLTAKEHSPRTSFILIRTRVLDRVMDAFCKQLQRIRESPDGLNSNASRFFTPKIQALFSPQDWGCSPDVHPDCPASWQPLKKEIEIFRNAMTEYHPESICKAWYWSVQLGRNGSFAGTPKPMCMDTSFSPQAIIVPAGSVLVRQPTNVETIMTFDSQVNPAGETELYMFTHINNAYFAGEQSYFIKSDTPVDASDLMWLPDTPSTFAADVLPPHIHGRPGVHPSPGVSPGISMAGLSVSAAMASPAPGSSSPAHGGGASGPSTPSQTGMPSPQGGHKRLSGAQSPGGKKGKGPNGGPKPKNKRTLASTSLAANTSMERELHAHGLYSFFTTKQTRKVADTAKKFLKVTDDTELHTSPIHTLADKDVQMPQSWRPDEGWTASISDKIPVCAGDICSHLFPSLVSDKTLFPGTANGQRINVGCGRGPDCSSRHIGSDTRGGSPWPLDQQMSPVALQRIRGILGAELNSCFTDELADTFTNYLDGEPAGFLLNLEATALGESPAKAGPPEYFSAANVTVHNSVYN